MIEKRMNTYKYIHIYLYIYIYIYIYGCIKKPPVSSFICRPSFDSSSASISMYKYVLQLRERRPTADPRRHTCYRISKQLARVIQIAVAVEVAVVVVVQAAWQGKCCKDCKNNQKIGPNISKWSKNAKPMASKMMQILQT